MLEDALEMRLFLQCNGDLHELMRDIQKYIDGQWLKTIVNNSSYVSYIMYNYWKCS